jgi:hypothetical protein
MKHWVLWFLSICMTSAFIQVVYFHKTPEQALISGVVIGATAAAMEMRIFPRLWRRLTSNR